MSLSLRGRIVLVTGAFGSLGWAVGTLLVGEGARVAFLDRCQPPTGSHEVGDALFLSGVDLLLPEQVEAAVARVRERFGHIDAIVNVAGGFAWETVADGSLDTWDRLYEINLRSTVAATRAVLPHLMAGGRVVNVGAQAALKAAAGMAAYAASKAGVMRFTEALAEELKDRNITVNAVLPSIIDTPANRADMPRADFGKWVSPAALARVIAFLLSDDGEAITGACLPVTGRV
ncbi:MAG: SDR family NAD(P)-dependent oxidoreductase [Aquincola sp.]|nr:SDR family NAD(P)-dependent oxidoreductase [Aquincola sp.]|tara:strand:+ start:6081 stop:6776 length:696 start_codon:yes stop_codon:yes gene_type:complete